MKEVVQSAHVDGTYQSRVKEVIDAVGGLKPMARRVSALLPFGQTVSYQAFQHLVQTEPRPAQLKKGGWKPANGSELDAAMAFVAGYSALWVSLGIGPKWADAAPPTSGVPQAWGVLLQSNRFTAAEIAEALKVSEDQAVGIIKGEVVPTDKDHLRKLSTLLRMPADHLANPASSGPLADAEKNAVMRLSPDERDIITIYRKLKPFGKRALRIRVVELQQEFLPGDDTNPFGEKKPNAN